MCEHDHTMQIKLELEGKVEFDEKAGPYIISIAKAETENRNGVHGHDSRLIIHGNGPEVLQMFMAIADQITKQIDIPEDIKALTGLSLALTFLPKDGNAIVKERKLSSIGMLRRLLMEVQKLILFYAERAERNLTTMPDDEKRKLMSHLSKKLFGDQKDIPNEK